ncbi:MAG TPA: hypothetical protein VGI08_01470, partial [Diaminobutyricibacter sp.]
MIKKPWRRTAFRAIPLFGTAAVLALLATPLSPAAAQESGSSAQAASGAHLPEGLSASAPLTDAQRANLL